MATATAPRVYLVYMPEEDRMAPGSPDDDARESAQRLQELIQALLPGRPIVVQALERCVVALLVDEVRQRIIDRLGRLTPEDLSTIDAVTAGFDRHKRDGERTP